MQPHLKISKIGKFVFLPGDAGRIDKILKFLEDTEEVNINREYRTCRGDYKGTTVSMVSSGIGCPAAAIAVEEIAKIGAEIVIRIGTCGGLLKSMQPGDIVIPTAAFCGDGTTKEYDPTAERVEADKKVVDALMKVAEKLGISYFKGTNRTHDAFYEPTENFVKLAGKGFVSSEMECSAVFLISKLRKMRAGAILVVVTPEAPEEVLKDPNMVYQLVDKEKVQRGVDNAIKIALEAVKILEGESFK